MEKACEATTSLTSRPAPIHHSAPRPEPGPEIPRSGGLVGGRAPEEYPRPDTLRGQVLVGGAQRGHAFTPPPNPALRGTAGAGCHLSRGADPRPATLDPRLETPYYLDSLIREGAELKAEIDSKTERLRRINLALAECATFKDGQRTAHLAGAGWHVKVRLHEIVSFDQEKLLIFRDYLPEEKFAQLFKTVYEPTSKKAIDGFLAHADKDLAGGLRWCMNVKPGAPQVTYEKIGEE